MAHWTLKSIDTAKQGCFLVACLGQVGTPFNAYRDQGAVEDGVEECYVVGISGRAQEKATLTVLQQVDIGHDNLTRRVTIWLGADKRIGESQVSLNRIQDRNDSSPRE